MNICLNFDDNILIRIREKMNNAILTNIYSRRILIIRANFMKSINYFTSRENHLIIIIFRIHCLTICTLTNGRTNVSISFKKNYVEIECLET